MRCPWLTAVLAAAVLTAGAAVEEGPAAALTARLETLAAGGAIPGFAVAIVTAEGVAYQHAFGYAELARRVPYTTETIQPVASVSKTVIGVCLMKAVEQGRAELDAPLGSVIGVPVVPPRFPEQPVTLRQLATHTSGIRDDDALYRQSYVPGDAPTRPLAAFLKEYFAPTGALPLRSAAFTRAAPGAGFVYTNVGAALAAQALGERVGMEFADYSAAVVFAPLGMTDTSWRVDPSKESRRATLYGRGGRALAPYTLLTYPDGGLRTTCRDLAQYLVEILRGHGGRGRLLTATSYAELLRPQFGAASMPKGFSTKEPNSALFWMLSRSGGLGHTGGDPGVTAIVAFNPKTGFGRLFIANIDVDEDPAAEKQMAAVWQALGEWSR